MLYICRDIGNILLANYHTDAYFGDSTSSWRVDRPKRLNMGVYTCRCFWMQCACALLKVGRDVLIGGLSEMQLQVRVKLNDSFVDLCCEMFLVNSIHEFSLKPGSRIPLPDWIKPKPGGGGGGGKLINKLMGWSVKKKKKN